MSMTASQGHTIQTFHQDRLLLWYILQVDGLTALGLYPMPQFELSLGGHALFHSKISFQESAVFECMSTLVTILVM